MSDFTPITAFNDQFGVEFTVAYGWNLANIILYLKNVSEDPVKYKAPLDRKADLDVLYKAIDKLKQGGAMFTTPTPAQQLLRTATAIAPSKKFPWGTATQQEFFIIFDLLGIFLSLMGVPPSTQTLTAKNYSLPLVFLYGKWCQVLATNTLGVRFTPTVAQITWGTSTDGKTFFPFLGASAAGFSKEQNWQFKTQRKRWDYINTILKTPYKGFPNDSPVRRTNQSFKGGGQRFGNCGETYPFLYILSIPAYVHNCYGIALQIAAVETTYSNPQLYWNKKYLMPPCENCRQILTWYDLTAAEKNRFRQWI